MTSLIKPLKSLSTKNIQVTELGCIFTGSESNWEVLSIAKKTKRVDKAIPFFLADLYNQHPDIITAEYDPNIDGTGHYSLGSIRVYATTLKNWPVKERRWNFGISFYQAVYHLPKDWRDGLMELAAAEDWNRNKLREKAALLAKPNRLPSYVDDVLYEQDKYIHTLEQRVNELEGNQESQKNKPDYNLLIDNIIRLIQKLRDEYPEGVEMIKEYLQ